MEKQASHVTNTRGAIGKARLRTFTHTWVSETETRVFVVHGIVPVLHKAKDGSMLVRIAGGYQLFVYPEQIIQVMEV